DALLGDVVAQPFDDLQRRLDADVGLDQQGFEVLVELLVDRRAVEERGDLGEDPPASLLQTRVDLRVRCGLSAEDAIQNHEVTLPVFDGRWLQSAAGTGLIAEYTPPPRPAATRRHGRSVRNQPARA